MGPTRQPGHGVRGRPCLPTRYLASAVPSRKQRHEKGSLWGAKELPRRGLGENDVRAARTRKSGAAPRVDDFATVGTPTGRPENSLAAPPAPAHDRTSRSLSV